MIKNGDIMGLDENIFDLDEVRRRRDVARIHESLANDTGNTNCLNIIRNLPLFPPILEDVFEPNQDNVVFSVDNPKFSFLEVVVFPKLSNQFDEIERIDSIEFYNVLSNKILENSGKFEFSYDLALACSFYYDITKRGFFLSSQRKNNTENYVFGMDIVRKFEQELYLPSQVKFPLFNR